ncbi:hypothetical protein [Paeniglutamicibacter sp.]|uniref:hypothetical protein n=1 Tax=Paeniglutamicibacter sp. TaxID=1934391 RepID=UPI0039894008
MERDVELASNQSSHATLVIVNTKPKCYAGESPSGTRTAARRPRAWWRGTAGGGVVRGAGGP